MEAGEPESNTAQRHACMCLAAGAGGERMLAQLGPSDLTDEERLRL
jgi:hypothetical protein